MSDTLDKINERNLILYGPICKKCVLFSAQCRCLNNDSWKNRDVNESLQKVYMHMYNAGKLEDKKSIDPNALGKELHEVLKNIEMSGHTVDEILIYMHDNYKKL